MCIHLFVNGDFSTILACTGNLKHALKQLAFFEAIINEFPRAVQISLADGDKGQVDTIKSDNGSGNQSNSEHLSLIVQCMTVCLLSPRLNLAYIF
jgi:hypothetical protein